MSKVSWPPVIERAANIVNSYDTQVTLRQVFYRLVAAEVIPNTKSAYTSLSRHTARARRDGWFPALADATRNIHSPGGWGSPHSAVWNLARQYRRPRDEGQDAQIWLLAEKRTLLAQLEAWFDEKNLTIVALGGYESETLDRMIRRRVRQDGRPAVGFYLGDMDPTGEDIERNLNEHVGRAFQYIDRIALTWDQIDYHNLPILAGKRTDPRAKAFARRHGRLTQVEIEALDPNDLHNYLDAAVDTLWNFTTWEDVKQREATERDAIFEAADRL